MEPSPARVPSLRTALSLCSMLRVRRQGLSGDVGAPAVVRSPWTGYASSVATATAIVPSGSSGRSRDPRQ